MENNDNNDQDPPNPDPVENEPTKKEKPPPKTPTHVSSTRRTLANMTHYSDLRHFQRLVNEYQKNPEELPR